MTGIATKPRLSGNMLPKIKTCENEWSNFSENLRVMEIKFIELTEFASPNQSIFFNFVRVWVYCAVDIFKLTFLNSVVIEGDYPCTVHFYKNLWLI